MNSEFFSAEINSKGIGILTFNRPEIHNAFNDKMIKELTSLFKSWDSDEKVRMIFIKGKGKSFCAGADLNWMKSMKEYTLSENIADSKEMAKMFHTLNNFKGPVIAYVHGNVLGGGMGMICCCDYVVSEENTKFGFTEVALGLLPAVISPFVISKIGESYARAYLLSGHRFSTKEALQMGVIHEVVQESNEEERNKAQYYDSILKKFTYAGPKAQITAKKLVKEVLKDLMGKGLKQDYLTQKTAEFIARARASEEGQEGMQALLDKRKPNWLQ